MGSDKVAIIVGGGSGMGAAAARKLAADGFHVAILSSSGKGEALAQELGGIGVTGSNQSSDDLKRLVDADDRPSGAASTRWSTARATARARPCSRSPTSSGTRVSTSIS